MTREARGQRSTWRGRWLAHPWLSAVIAVSWVLLQQSLAPANLLWALILALGLPALLHDFLGPGTRVRAGTVALKLMAVVLWDIVRANLAVARIVLHPGIEPKSAWLQVPYSLTEARGIALLATIITNTPGTISCVVDEDRRQILVHALNVSDPEAEVAEMLRRYERPLKEIFG